MLYKITKHIPYEYFISKKTQYINAPDFDWLIVDRYQKIIDERGEWRWGWLYYKKEVTSDLYHPTKYQRNTLSFYIRIWRFYWTCVTPINYEDDRKLYGKNDKIQSNTSGKEV